MMIEVLYSRDGRLGGSQVPGSCDLCDQESREAVAPRAARAPRFPSSRIGRSRWDSRPGRNWRLTEATRSTDPLTASPNTSGRERKEEAVSDALMRTSYSPLHPYCDFDNQPRMPPTKWSMSFGCRDDTRFPSTTSGLSSIQIPPCVSTIGRMTRSGYSLAR